VGHSNLFLEGGILCTQVTFELQKKFSLTDFCLVSQKHNLPQRKISAYSAAFSAVKNNSPITYIVK